MTTPIIRRSVLGLVIAGALTVAALTAAPPSQAATLYACVKKNGSAKVFSKKPKCKKGEKKLSWNTAGPAGANGKNGINGTNGKEGAPGQPQKASAFAASLEASLLSTVSTPLFSLSGVSISLGCSNALLSDRVLLQATGPAGTRAVSGMSDSRVNGEATEAFQKPVYNVGVTPTATPFAELGMNGAGTKGNMGHVNASIVTSGAVIVLDAFIEVNEGSKNCVASGVAFSIPA